MGCSVDVERITMCFKGNDRDKLCIMYKSEGDGFQSDALCDNGYFYQVYIRNDPAPKNYLKQGIFPLHSRMMDLFDSSKDDHRQVGMYNLYNSAAFSEIPTTMIANSYATAWIASTVEEFPYAYSKKRRRILLYINQHGVPSRQLF